ncbi:cyclase [Micromonospora sp. NPDC000663]|uniref:cyclase n=1 Tax=Micromonospora sp. NPDC000663 TaxID=3364218 RepID=UPI00369E5F40
MTSNSTRWALLGVTTVTAAGVGRAVARRRHRRQPDRQDGWYVVRRAVTVDRPRDTVRAFWTDRQPAETGLPAAVTAAGPGSLTWRSVDGPTTQEGRIELADAPQGRGTEIRAELRYRSGPLRRVAGLVKGDEPDLALRDALRRAKALIECGQVVDTRHDPSGRSPAQEKATDKAREKLMTGGRA